MKKILVAVIICMSFLIGRYTTGHNVDKIIHWKEWQCLESEQLNFKDPDSVKLIANLGNREYTTYPDIFFVRYAAKNGYNAYIQGNIICHNGTEGYERDTTVEEIIQLEIETSLIKHGVDSHNAERVAKEEIYETTTSLKYLLFAEPIYPTIKT